MENVSATKFSLPHLYIMHFLNLERKGWHVFYFLWTVFSVYLNGAAGDKRSITGNIISQLLAIQQFFEKQKMLKFIASSLLVVYEANTTDKGAEMSNMNDNTVGAPRHSSPQSMSSDPQTEVRMIDMAHVFEHQEQDDNYLFGLNSLIMHFERQK